jgi:hypothetical protein
LAGRRPDAGSGGSAVRAALLTVEAREDLLAHLRGEFEGELLEEEAMTHVQERITART